MNLKARLSFDDFSSYIVLSHILLSSPPEYNKAVQARKPTQQVCKARVREHSSIKQACLCLVGCLYCLCRYGRVQYVSFLLAAMSSSRSDVVTQCVRPFIRLFVMKEFFVALTGFVVICSYEGSVSRMFKISPLYISIFKKHDTVTGGSVHTKHKMNLILRFHTYLINLNKINNNIDSNK